MFRLLKIILAFWLVPSVFAVDLENNLKIYYPEYISTGSQFEISIIISQTFFSADRLDIYLIPDHSLTINKTQLWTSKGKSNISFSSQFLDKFSVSSKKLSINLSDTTTFSYSSFFQIVIELISNPVTYNGLKVYGEFLKGGEIIGHLFNSDQIFSTNDTYLYSITFNYFEKYSTAGSAAVFYPGSYLNVPLDYKFENVLSSGFWIKLDRFNSTFLKIIDQELNRTLYEFLLNDNQMLITSSGKNNLTQLKSIFISNNIWYHLNLIIDKSKSELSLFCNNYEILRSENNNFINYDNLVMHIQNESSSGNFNIEQIRLVKCDGSLSGINKNINYSDYSDDSSLVAFQMDFQETELMNLLNDRKISYEGLHLVKSDAPVFPRAPIINVKPMNNFYEIEWTGSEVNNASYYVLERATVNNPFSEIGRIAADSENEKKYSLLTEKQKQSEIIYFRIKQIDKDGTKVYSDVIKVGQGTIDDVVLSQNFPNPFNPTTQIEFELLQDSDVELKIFNLAGKEIILLHKGFLQKGIHQFKFDATGLPSGIYLYQVSTPLSSHSHKMILAK
jgi:hypothetical protein